MENENTENTEVVETVETDNKAQKTSEEETRGAGFENRTRESLEDEVLTLRREAANRRQTAKETAKNLEDRIAALEAQNTSQQVALRVANLKSLGLTDEDIELLKDLDEETATAVASRLASTKKQDTSKIDPNQRGIESRKAKTSAILTELDRRK